MIHNGPSISTLIIALLMLTYSGLQAQFTARLDSNRLIIGEQTRLYLEAQLPPNVDSFSLNSPLDTLPVTVLEESDWKRSGTYLKKEYLLSIYDSVYVQIPPFKLQYRTATDTTLLSSNDLALVGMFPNLPDSLALAPIKPIIEEPLTVEDIIPWVAGVIIVVLLILLYIWWRKRRKIDAGEQALAPPQPAHEIAFRHLAELKAQELWQQGQHKEYQSDLSHIFREYLENRYRFQALEMTSDEIDGAMQQRSIEPDLRKQALDILRKADLVKYAKAEPTVEWQQASIELVEKWVRDTKFVPEPLESEKTDSAS